MSARSGLVVLACALACRPPPARPPLAPAGFCPPAGAACDDGAGELARASAQLVIGDDQGPAFGESRTRRTTGDPYGGDPYGGAPYGGDAYGGLDYAGYVTPPTPFASVGTLRHPRYAEARGLTGAVEGVVTWSGP